MSSPCFLSFMYAGTIEFIRYDSYYRKSVSSYLFYFLPIFFHLYWRTDPYLVQSEMILSFMYLQFNIDRYIPCVYTSLLLIFPAQFGILERSILFFSYYPLLFRMKPKECLIMIWIASLSLIFILILSLG